MPSSAKSGMDECRQRWESRILRARELQNRHSAMASALRLYEATLRFQLEVALASKATLDSGIPLRNQIDLSLAASKMPALLSIAIECAPETLAGEARGSQQAGRETWIGLLQSCLNSNSALAATEDFFARACLQPLAELLQLQLPTDSNYGQSSCPACGGLAQLSVLRPEGEGASRWLSCSFCLREWLFRRVICPWCAEENKEKLPRYSPDEYAHAHVEACDTCKRYLKSVDMTIDGHAVPLIDEAALAVLDVWASEHGYTKIVRNLIGF